MLKQPPLEAPVSGNQNLFLECWRPLSIQEQISTKNLIGKILVTKYVSQPALQESYIKGAQGP